MRFHVTGLPHTQTTRAYDSCAFTSNVRGFCRMMKSLGHEVILYASEDNDAPCDELVTCIAKEEQAYLSGVTGPENILVAKYDAKAPHWVLFNERVNTAIRARASHTGPRDIVALTGGATGAPSVKGLNMYVVEYTAGYEGVMYEGSYRVFPSYAWAQAIYTYENQGRAHSARGRMTDTVIPHYFDPAPADYPFVEEKDDYFLFVGRLNEDKGVQLAADVAAKAGVRLVVAGPGTPPEGTDYRGLVGIEERGKLMASARATFAPSLYLEPFGKVAVESLLCGTPVICTDWGAFPEIVQEGVDGFRCRSAAEFMSAASAVTDTDPAYIRKRAIDRFSEDNIRHQYQRFFDRITATGGA